MSCDRQPSSLLVCHIRFSRSSRRALSPTATHCCLSARREGPASLVSGCSDEPGRKSSSLMLDFSVETIGSHGDWGAGEMLDNSRRMQATTEANKNRSAKLKVTGRGEKPHGPNDQSRQTQGPLGNIAGKKREGCVRSPGSASVNIIRIFFALVRAT